MKMQDMRKLTAWASLNHSLARWIITLANISLFVLMMQTAGYAQQHWPDISPVLLTASIFIFAIASFLLHRFKVVKKISSSTVKGYVLVRAKYFAVLFGSLLMVFSYYYFNQHIPSHTGQVVYSIEPAGSVKPVKPVRENYSDESLFLHDLSKYYKTLSRKELVKEYRYYRQLQKEDPSTAGTVGLIILTILGALVLAYVVAALACSISCGGSEALAVVVAIIGLAAVVLGAIWLIRKIVRKRRRNAAAD